MYKIAPLILNSGKKSGGAGQIFIAQPDAQKEDSAGKLFILFEAIGKSADLNQVADFLIANLNYYYYENEKIALLGSIKDLRPENIFESALAKTNAEFWEWINNEKLSFNPREASITAGIVLDKEIHFSSFGSNSIKLVYRKGGTYEIVDLLKNEPENEGGDKIFSSVISGQLPPDSSFILSNEALPEYISEESLKDIVSKLPPISASEQLKNTLAASNSFVPFLAIIVKSTKMNPENREANYSDFTNAHSSMNNLNYTEEKTERLLSPIGTINLKKGVKKAGSFLEKFMPRPKNPELNSRNNQREEIRKEETNRSPLISPISAGPQKIGISEPMRRRAGKGGNSGPKLEVVKVILRVIAISFKGFLKIFHISFWKDAPKKTKKWFLALNLQQKILSVILVIISLTLLISLFFTGNINQARQEKKIAENVIANIKAQEDQIDIYLLYGNEEGAKLIAQKIGSDIASLSENQKNNKDFEAINEKYNNLLAKIQHLNKVEATEVFDFSTNQAGANPETLYLLKDYSLFAFDSSTKTSFLYDLKNSEAAKNNISQLNSPIYGASDKSGNVYLFSGQNIGKLNASENTLAFTPVALDNNQVIAGFGTYRNFSYLLDSGDGKVYKYVLRDGKYQKDAARTAPEDANTSAFAIDDEGQIFTVKKTGEIQKYVNGEKKPFTSDSLLPATSGISKITINGSNLYLVDRQEKRIIVFTLDSGKTKAKFKAQYQFTNLPELKDATISGNTAYLLSGSKVYKAEMK